MKNFLMSFGIILVFYTNGFSQEVPVAGINWSDSDEMIISKINQIDRLAGMTHYIIKQRENINLCTPDIVMSKTDKATSASNEIKENIQSNIDTLIFNSSSLNNYLQSIEFSRSKIIGKLLSIQMFFDTRHAQRYDRDIVGRYLKKYGIPSRVIKDIFQWNIDTVEIHVDESNENLKYYHLNSINEHCHRLRIIEKKLVNSNRLDVGSLFK